MPDKMWKQCKVPGCGGLTKDRYCEKHTHLVDKEKKEQQWYYNKNIRDNDSQKFYESSQWRKVRTLYIKRNPLCEQCLKDGRITPATIVDHKIEIKDGGAPLDSENLQSLCRSCHNKKTANERSNRNKNRK